jgi:xanthine dehydrogenase YagT iron-sulfur-binding subunit
VEDDDRDGGETRGLAEGPEGERESDGSPPGDVGEGEGWSRRGFLATSIAALPIVQLASAGVLEAKATALQESGVGRAGGTTMRVAFEINGKARRLQVDPRASLLDTLRGPLGLPGTKKGCDHGQCGACTVLIDDRRVLSCLTLAAMADGHKVTTIEGLADGDRLHPVQAAFLEHDGFQCGYCTPGQIVSAVGLLKEGCPSDPAGIRELMSGNLCRCGAYPNIVDAIRSVAGKEGKAV